MDAGAIILMAVIGFILATLYYGISIFDIFLVRPLLFTFLAVTVGVIVFVVTSRRRRNGLSGGTRTNPRRNRRPGSRR